MSTEHQINHSVLGTQESTSKQERHTHTLITSMNKHAYISFCVCNVYVMAQLQAYGQQASVCSVYVYVCYSSAAVLLLLLLSYY